jgi:Domain of unknown function (DUF6484)
MKVDDLPLTALGSSCASDLLWPLLRESVKQQPRSATASPLAPVVGELIALSDAVRPLVRCPDQPDVALRARSTIELQGCHVGRSVLLVFEHGDPQQPIVVGVLVNEPTAPAREEPAPIHVDVDGDRMLVTAHEQLVLRCGKASITLTKAGKVLIEGTYVSSRAAGLNRLQGGCVQIN